MKKVILSLVIVFAMSSFTVLKTEEVIVENMGPAGDCVKSAKEKSLWAVHVNGGSPMDYYMAYYIDCLYAIE